MNPATRNEWKWFWAWDDEREEIWLRHMARQGWHLCDVGLPGLYKFEYGTPRDVAYRLDFKLGGRDWQSYRQLFADAGWEYVGRTGSWIYFRKEARDGEPDEIFTDNASKVRKYRSVMLVIAFILMWYGAILQGPTDHSGTAFQVFFAAKVLFILFLLYALGCLLHRVRTLRRRL